MRETDTPVDDMPEGAAPAGAPPLAGAGADSLPEPKNLRTLRRMVTGLTATMILGILTILVLIVIKIAQPAPAPLPLPPAVTLPAGESAEAVTQGRDWFAIVTRDAQGTERIRLFNPDGSERQSMEITP